MSARHRQHKRRLREASNEILRLRRLRNAYEDVLTDMKAQGWMSVDIAVHAIQMRQQDIAREMTRLVSEVADLERSMPA